MHPTSTSQDLSIAVLPFVNMSSNPENEYFSDGMTEEIINALAQIKRLKVTSRTSSFFFKGKNIPITQIGQQLNVAIILEGSVRLSGKSMRITAQLIDVQEDFHFWSATFDRSIDNIFAVQDEISLLIADKIREHLGHFSIHQQLVKTPNLPVDAYQIYLKSRFFILKMTKPSILQGMEMLKQLLEREPNFALAHLGMHLGYTLLATLGFMASKDGFIQGQAYLNQAIAIAPNLPECQLQLAWISFLQDWEFPQSYTHIQRALEIRPSADGYQTMTSTLVAEGQYKAAHHYIDIALQIDPFSGITHHLKGYILYAQEQYDAALHYFKKSNALNPQSNVSVLYLGQTLILMGRLEEAMQYFEQLPPDDSNDVRRVGGITLVHAAMGNLEQATTGIQQLQNAIGSDLTERAINILILCYALLGDTKQTLAYLEKGIEYRLPLIIYMNIEPCLKMLHRHPRFKELMQLIFKAPTASFPVPKKYKNTPLDSEESDHYHQQLQQLMQEEQPFLEPSLSLRQLAQQLDWHPNKLSQLLNDKIGKNFSEYINHYRVHTFMQLAQQPTNAHLSLLGLAFESGFNSKTTFNTFFKKETGMTPKQWRQQTFE